MMQMAQDFGSADTIIAICLTIVIFVVVGDALVLRPLSRLFQPRVTSAPARQGLWRRARAAIVP
jgi:sulfonate transport system permease protein